MYILFSVVWAESLICINLGICFKDFSGFFLDDEILFYVKKVLVKYFLKKKSNWPKIDHFYPTLGPKTYMSCSQNQLYFFVKFWRTMFSERNWQYLIPFLKKTILAPKMEYFYLDLGPKAFTFCS